jgi:glutathione S-transferase
MPELVSLAYSPWSEKARWALDHRRIAYTATPFQPLISELNLRRRMGDFRGRVSVPVFFTGEAWLRDSFEIATWADAHGEGAPLFPEGQREEVERYNRLSEQALAAARAIQLPKVLANRQWSLALVPKKLRPLLGPLGVPVARFGIRRTLKKYGDVAEGDHDATLRGALEQVRAALGEEPAAGPATLLPTFSYADIAVAQVLQMIEPNNLGGFRLGSEGREGYRNPALAEAFPDLIAWRDALYAAHRPAPQPRGAG